MSAIFLIVNSGERLRDTSGHPRQYPPMNLEVLDLGAPANGARRAANASATRPEVWRPGGDSVDVMNAAWVGSVALIARHSGFPAITATVSTNRGAAALFGVLLILGGSVLLRARDARCRRMVPKKVPLTGTRVYFALAYVAGPIFFVVCGILVLAAAAVGWR